REGESENLGETEVRAARPDGRPSLSGPARARVPGVSCRPEEEFRAGAGEDGDGPESAAATEEAHAPRGAERSGEPCGAGDGHHGPPASPENAQTGAEQRRDTILSCGHPAIRPPVPAFGGDFPESAVRGRDGEPRPGSRPERSGHRSSGNRNGGTVLRCGSPNAPNGFSPYHQSEYPVGRLLRRGRPPARAGDPSWGGTVRRPIDAARAG